MTIWAINQYLFYTMNDCWKLGGAFGMVAARRGVVVGSHGRRELDPASQLCPAARDQVQLRRRLGCGLGLPEESTIFAIDAILTF